MHDPFFDNPELAADIERDEEPCADCPGLGKGCCIDDYDPNEQL